MFSASLCLNVTSSHLTVGKTRTRTLQTDAKETLPIYLCLCPVDFLGRTEIRVAEIKKDQGSKGPITKRLLLHEVPTGEIVVRLDLQLFEEP